MEFGIYPTLTRTYILERISQEDIMSFYLGIPLNFTNLVKSPFRKDDNPTCGFHYNKYNRLRFRDFSGHFWGDCFDVVAYRLNVNSSDKKAFQLILHTIAKDFKLHKYENSIAIQQYELITKDFFATKKIKEKTQFKIYFREYNYHDDGYWNKFNINRTLLSYGRVFAAQEIYIFRKGQDPKLIYTYSTKDPAYCYYGGKDTNNIDNWKIYYPFRKKKEEQRFHSNSSFLQGKHLIKGGKIGLITKAYKDVLSFRSFGIQSVAPSAESVLLSKEEYEFMNSKFDLLLSCMDYDRAGKRMAQLLRKTYNIQPIMFTNGRFNTIDYGVKDFAEYVDVYKNNKTKELLTTIYKQLKTKYKW
jgi:hypothetical protein